jgi:hypothetical protein
MERPGIPSVDGEAEALAHHGTDQSTFQVANGKRHQDSVPSADRPYQSRRREGGKRGSVMLTVVATTVVVPAFCLATWHQSAALAILAASVLLWLVPLQPRWWARRTEKDAREKASPARRSAADISLVLGCWLLATWALWQHRLLPLAVCAVAGALVLADILSRPAAPPPLCTPERTPRRRLPDTALEPQA